jgi:PTS system glucose-specific IIC component
VALVNKGQLKALGASGTVVIGQGIQAIFGPLAEGYKTEMEEYIAAGGMGAAAPAAAATSSSSTVSKAALPQETAIEVAVLLASLGGKENIKELSACAATRLRLSVKESAKVDLPGLKSAGVLASVAITDQLLHLIVRRQAETLAKELKTACA